MKTSSYKSGYKVGAFLKEHAGALAFAPMFLFFLVIAVVTLAQASTTAKLIFLFFLSVPLAIFLVSKFGNFRWLLIIPAAFILIGVLSPREPEPEPYNFPRCQETQTHTCTWAGQPVLKKNYRESEN